MYLLGNKQFSEMRAPLAARREPAGGSEQAAKCSIFFNIKPNTF